MFSSIAKKNLASKKRERNSFLNENRWCMRLLIENFEKSECTLQRNTICLIKIVLSIWMKRILSRRFVKTYIKKILRFERTMIFRSEDEHAQLKRHLRAFIDDLKTMMNNINLLFKNEIHDHFIEWNENKIRYFVECRKFIFHQLSALITFYAIKQMLSQLKLLIKKTIVIFFCIDVFIKTMKLFCNHKMQKRLF
jgi:hypothetical protein